MIVNRKVSYFLYVVLIFSIIGITSDSLAANRNVWANSKSRVYHCEGARWYGKTKQGFFIDEVKAIKNGYRAANNNRCSAEGRAALNEQSNKEGSQNIVWMNTSSKVYHCQGTRYYGATKRGKYMGQGEAIKLGGRPSHGKRCN